MVTRSPEYWFAVTPSDSADLSPQANVGLFVTGAGNLTFLGQGGANVQIAAPANSYVWCRVRRVLATGTTATGIFALV